MTIDPSGTHVADTTAVTTSDDQQATQYVLIFIYEYECTMTRFRLLMV